MSFDVISQNYHDVFKLNLCENIHVYVNFVYLKHIYAMQNYTCSFGSYWKWKYMTNATDSRIISFVF